MRTSTTPMRSWRAQCAARATAPEAAEAGGSGLEKEVKGDDFY